MEIQEDLDEAQLIKTNVVFPMDIVIIISSFVSSSESESLPIRIRTGQSCEQVGSFNAMRDRMSQKRKDIEEALCQTRSRRCHQIQVQRKTEIPKDISENEMMELRILSSVNRDIETVRKSSVNDGFPFCDVLTFKVPSQIFYDVK